MDCGAGGADGAEKPNPSNANREAPSLVNVMQIGSMFYFGRVSSQKVLSPGRLSFLGVQSSVVDSLRVDGDRTVLFQLRIGLQLRCPAVVALAAILLQDPKRCLS